MRKFYFLAGLWTVGFGHAQIPTATWVRQLQINAISPVPGEAVGRSVVTDTDGNVYSTGYFNGGTQDLDPGTGSVSFSSVSNMGGYSTPDIYVTKHTENGDLAWARQMGGEYNDYAIDLAVNADGDVYITGYYKGDPDMDPGAAEVLAPAMGNQDIFVVKLDASGDFVWLKTFGSGGNDQGNSIALDADGNVYLAGNFNGTVDFDPGVGTNEFTSAGSDDIFVLKLNENGDLQWAHQLSGDGNDYAYAMAVDTDAHVYLTGAFNSSLDLDPGAGDASYGTNRNYDLFWVELDDAGDFVWGRCTGGDGSDYGYDIAADASGNIYATGVFSGTSAVDFGGTSLTSGGHADFFVTKMNSSGTLQWVKNCAGAGNDAGRSLALDPAGNIYVTGYYSQMIDFNPGTGVNELTVVHGVDLFILKLDNSGNYSWAKSYGGSNEQWGQSIAASSNNEILITGHLYLNMTLDDTTIGCPPPPAAVSDAFIAKLSVTGAPVGLDETTRSENTFHVFPNPATNQIQMDMAAPGVLKIFSLTGDQVLAVNVLQGMQILDISSLTPGIYFIENSLGQKAKFSKQ